MISKEEKLDLKRIMLRRKSTLCLQYFKKSNQEENKELERLLYVVCIDFNKLGFSLSKELLFELYQSSVEYIREFYTVNIELLKEITCVDYFDNPMYNNFPKCMEEIDSIDLFLNAIINYAVFI